MNLKKSVLCRLFFVSLTLNSTAKSQDHAILTQQALNASSMLLLKVDSDQLAIPERIQKMRDEYKDKPIASLIDASQRNLASIRELTKGQTVCLSVDMPYTTAVLLRATAPKSVLASDLEKIAKHLAGQIAISDRSTTELTKLDIGTDPSMTPASEPPAMPAEQAARWQAALEANKEFPVQGVMMLPDYVIKTF